MRDVINFKIDLYSCRFQSMIITSFFLSLYFRLVAQTDGVTVCVNVCLLSMSLLLCDMKMHAWQTRSETHAPHEITDHSREGLVIAIDVVVVVVAAAVVEEHLLLLEGRWSAHPVTTSTVATSVDDLPWLWRLLLLHGRRGREAIVVPVSSGLLLSGSRWVADKLLVSRLLLWAVFRAHRDCCLGLVLFLAHVHFNVQTIILFVPSAPILAIRATLHKISPRLLQHLLHVATLMVHIIYMGLMVSHKMLLCAHKDLMGVLELGLLSLTGLVHGVCGL